MSTHKIQSVLLAIIFLFSLSCKNKYANYVVENEIIIKQFGVNKTKPGKIIVSVGNKVTGEKIANSLASPYFEFVVDNRLVTSNHENWVFANATTREMNNGGTEHLLVFEGREDPVVGLQVKIIQQIFPNSTLIREKLEIHSAEKSITLNKLNDKLHFRFPVYNVLNPGNLPANCTEIRIASWEKKPITFGEKEKGNHMYYPDVINSTLSEAVHSAKGPVSIAGNQLVSWFSAYEHASQDNLNGLLRKSETTGGGNLINDAMQGTKGVFNFPISDEDFKFLGIQSKAGKKTITISIEALRGAYLNGEIIDSSHPYSSVWTASGFYEGENLETGKQMLRNYLFNQICEKKASRIPEFYYNTWGLQRNDKTKPLRGILTYERIFQEIEYAAELGVDIFVLDDGWQVTQGIWTPNLERLPNGLAPIKEKLDEHGIKLGLWFSPMGIDSTTQRYKENQNWVIKDSNGNPILAQWDHPAFDFVSGFFEVFIEDCKKMVDQGCRFMKWDAINTFYSSLANLNHGADNYSTEEIRARYEYLLPIYVVRAMEILTDYEPELIIEVDLTEARRVMTGLAPLSQGKLFWMNNGASWYNDYTTFRTKSMRTIANEFAGIVPLELFTYANYPHNITGNMEYNVHNSLLAGHGFWGNLELMNTQERNWIGSQVKLSKQVLPFLVDVNPRVTGKVGDSPEIYSIVNANEAAGQIVVFSENPIELQLNEKIAPEKFLTIVNEPFALEDGLITMKVKFSRNESSSAIFILPNKNSGVSIVSSTSAINSVELTENKLSYSVSSPGIQIIHWAKSKGKPAVTNLDETFSVVEKDDYYQIRVETNADNQMIQIQS